MRRILPLLIDLACGVLFVAVAFFAARVLLASARLVYLCFPLLAAVALAAGLWRGARSELPLLLVAVVMTLPLLIVTLQFVSGRDRPLFAFPAVIFVFVCIGVAMARSRPKPWIVAPVLAVAGIAGALAGPRLVRLIVPNRHVNEMPAPFVIRLVDGTTLSSPDLAGKVVVLDFWATWCVPCQHELPAIQRVYDEMKNQSDVLIVAVDGVMTDAPGDAGDSKERAAAYFRRGGYTIPLAWDGGAVLERSFALKGFPSLIILDRAGRVRMRRVGYIGSENLEDVLTGEIAALR